MFKTRNDIEVILSALAEQIEEAGGRNIDIVAFVDKNSRGGTVLRKAVSLDSLILQAAEKVKRDFNLNDRWINNEPASIMDFGLPRGLMERARRRDYGKSLCVHFIGRYDQIHFKLYAAADQGAGKHFDDLKSLSPSPDEIEAAAVWAMTHDVSEGFKIVLIELLNKLGFKDVAKRL